MRKLVLLGVILHFVIGVGHLACLFCLEAVFNIYGINGMMGEIAAHGAGLPYLITVCIAIAFLSPEATGCRFLDSSIGCHSRRSRSSLCWLSSSGEQSGE